MPNSVSEQRERLGELTIHLKRQSNANVRRDVAAILDTVYLLWGVVMAPHAEAPIHVEGR